MAGWSERWFPDPLVFALAGIVIVFIFGLILGESPAKLAIAGGKSFWSLVPFTMQMVMIIVGIFITHRIQVWADKLGGEHPGVDFRAEVELAVHVLDRVLNLRGRHVLVLQGGRLDA